ncbi:MAG: protein-L-isoaspartate(D-aspartate) O-methyltransferase [Deltaproteobacteria bacterium]|nr:protein-L-isoaspartate(D-aspartate) O-methyltransferase [Deltaproteobacteria bacterium]
MDRGELQHARKRMVEEQVIARGVGDSRVLAAMARVPREHFVDPALAFCAYDDRPLNIGYGQTISQPFIVARMCELAFLSGSERVLEVGAGCGYQTAILSELACEVLAVEIIRPLADLASGKLRQLGIANAHVECFDGSLGWPEKAPFDVIVVAAGAPKIPVLLCAQLGEGGRLVIPVGPRDHQKLAVVVRHGDDFETRYDTRVRFVDLVGRYGWGGSPPPQA